MLSILISRSPSLFPLSREFILRSIYFMVKVEIVYVGVKGLHEKEEKESNGRELSSSIKISESFLCTIRNILESVSLKWKVSIGESVRSAPNFKRFHHFSMQHWLNSRRSSRMTEIGHILSHGTENLGKWFFKNSSQKEIFLASFQIKALQDLDCGVWWFYGMRLDYKEHIACRREYNFRVWVSIHWLSVPKESFSREMVS